MGPVLEVGYVEFGLVGGSSFYLSKWDSDPRIQHYELNLEIICRELNPLIISLQLNISFEVDFLPNIKERLFFSSPLTMIVHIGNSNNASSPKRPSQQILDRIQIIKPNSSQSLITKKIQRASQQSSSIVQPLHSNHQRFPANSLCFFFDIISR